MKRVLLSLVLISGLNTVLFAQEIERESWAGQPVLHTIDSKYNEESAVIVLDKRRMEYIDVKDELAVYKTLHRIIHINDDKGIESFNRVYLPVSDNSDIVDITIRVRQSFCTKNKMKNVKPIRTANERNPANPLATIVPINNAILHGFPNAKSDTKKH